MLLGQRLKVPLTVFSTSISGLPRVALATSRHDLRPAAVQAASLSRQARNCLRSVLILPSTRAHCGRAVSFLAEISVEPNSARPSCWVDFMKSCRRSEEHTSELQSLMRISYAVFCL